MIPSKIAGPSRIKVKTYCLPPPEGAAQRRAADPCRWTEQQARLSSLGIRPVTGMMFEWGGLRFSSADAAIEAAKNPATIAPAWPGER